MLINVLMLVVGFPLLVFGADGLVKGAASVARRLQIPSLVVGLTIVAFGTSMPELVVNIVAALEGSTNLAVSNIVGSNIANILLILGTAAVIYPVNVARSTVWREIPLSFFATFTLLFLGSSYLPNENIPTIGPVAGAFFLVCFLGFLVYTYRLGLTEDTDDTSHHLYTPFLSAVLIIGGISALVLGGRFIVMGAIALATALNISENLIGLSVVAVGTSLPELAASVVAAYRKQSGIAVGNIVGSNIFNIFLILGITSLIQPIPMVPNIMDDVVVLAATSSLLFLSLFVGTRHRIDRWQGVLFVVLYLLFIATSAFRDVA